MNVIASSCKFMLKPHRWASFALNLARLVVEGANSALVADSLRCLQLRVTPGNRAVNQQAAMASDALCARVASCRAADVEEEASHACTQRDTRCTMNAMPNTASRQRSQSLQA